MSNGTPRHPLLYAAFLLCPACLRTNASPRFSSAPRSVPAVASWTDSPADSRPSQVFSSLREDSTYLPWRWTGIPSVAQRCATETGCPRKAAICCHPLSMSGSALGCLRFGIAQYDACSCCRAANVVSYTGFVMDVEQVIGDVERV